MDLVLLACDAWFPPFHCRGAVAVSPFRSAVPLCRSVALLPCFRSVATVAFVHENGIAGNVFRIRRDEVTRTLIGCPATAERQKQDSILLATVRQLR